MKNNIFEIDTNCRLVVKETHEIVPLDEPVFILRAKDKKALAAIVAYRSSFNPFSQEERQIQKIINEFREFKQENADLMQDPETAYN